MMVFIYLLAYASARLCGIDWQMAMAIAILFALADISGELYRIRKALVGTLQ